MSEKNYSSNKLFANKSIECSVDNCAHHCIGDKYCALSKISVTSTGVPAPQIPEQTDCKSFQPMGN